ncbi:MAG: DUF3604 domain-containing protein, partial [Clostridiales bacterium]|nr:DUF3604 domain-containing protein [Clostridiales bacterium]
EWLASTGYIEGERTITEVINELGNTQVMIIPHIGGSPCDMDCFDPVKMPALEIHSVHRNHEDFAAEAIKRGMKCGFIGGGDDHRGALGDCIPAARERFFSARTGLMGVYAKELTRESIWEAIFAKRVYATNGCKIALVFTVNGFITGSELELNEGNKLFFKFEAVLDGWFDHAELIQNNSMIARFSLNDNQILRFAGEHESVVQKGANAYYLKVSQTDGGTAWSSPIWVTGK